jgi:hypothetical protein
MADIIKVYRRSHTARYYCRGCRKRYPSFEIVESNDEDLPVNSMWCKACLKDRCRKYEIINPPTRDPKWYCPVHIRKLEIRYIPSLSETRYNEKGICINPATIRAIKVCRLCQKEKGGSSIGEILYESGQGPRYD